MSGSLRRVVAVGLTLAAIGIPARSAVAQLGVAIRGSTLGVGGEISYRASRHFGLRGGANYLSFTRDATIEGIDYSLTPKLQNGTAIADIFPFGSAFHFSGGVVWNSNEAGSTPDWTGRSPSTGRPINRATWGS
jgi:hypothetical protein